MARYRDHQYLKASQLSDDDHAAFDIIHPPGGEVDNSGIYRCEGCHREIAHNLGDPLPPQNHHQHGIEHGQILWRLIVASEG